MTFVEKSYFQEDGSMTEQTFIYAYIYTYTYIALTSAGIAQLLLIRACGNRAAKMLVGDIYYLSASDLHGVWGESILFGGFRIISNVS
jgi:hypothetical protein